MYRVHGPFEMLFGLLFLLLLVAAVAAVVVGLVMMVRRSSRTGGWTQLPANTQGRPGPATPAAGPAMGPHPLAAAEHLLADRLARGEIDVADYEQRLAALRRSNPPQRPPVPQHQPQPQPAPQPATPSPPQPGSSPS